MLDVALTYIARGWNPVPIPHRTKAPRGNDWQHRRITTETAPRYFNGAASNIGVQLGTASGGLTDIDLDCPEAIAVAPYIFTITNAVFGRASKRMSHYLYKTDLAATHEGAAVQLKDPKTKQVVLELRIGGGKGAQTVFPPSMHEDGEDIKWEPNCDGEPAEIEGSVLWKQAHLAAACALMARYWPADGGRHDAARVIGGFFARAGHRPKQIRVYAEAVAKAAGDPEWRDAAEDAATAFHEGKHAFGFIGLRDTFGEDIGNKIAE
jgi:hypothetical protein